MTDSPLKRVPEIIRQNIRQAVDELSNVERQALDVLLHLDRQERQSSGAPDDEPDAGAPVCACLSPRVPPRTGRDAKALPVDEEVPASALV